MSNVFLIPRAPNAEPRVRRALDRIASVLNALLRSGDIVQTGDETFTVGPGGTTILTSEVFGLKATLATAPQLPHPEDGSDVLSGRVFGNKVAYGVLG